MKTFLVCGLLVLAAILAYNLHTRHGVPIDRPELLVPAAAENQFIAVAVSWYLKPGTITLFYLGLEADSRNQLILAALFSWWLWLCAFRALRVVLLLKS